MPVETLGDTSVYRDTGKHSSAYSDTGGHCSACTDTLVPMVTLRDTAVSCRDTGEHCSVCRETVTSVGTLGHTVVSMGTLRERGHVLAKRAGFDSLHVRAIKPLLSQQKKKKR